MAIFNSVKALRPKRHFFNLSHSLLFDCDMGQLIPIVFNEVYPGDRFKIGNEIVVRFQPLIAPILHEINVYTEYFFVPNRLVWSDWEAFITGGVDGQDTHQLPLWTDYNNTPPPKYSLWDYFNLGLASPTSNDLAPVALRKYAYNLIWNTYYRDETIDNEVNITTNNNILYRRWKKDYFTSALPFQQRGVSPALPLFGTAPVVFGNDVSGYSATNPTSVRTVGKGGSYGNGLSIYWSSGSFNLPQAGDQFIVNHEISGGAYHYRPLETDLSSVVAGNVADLRLAFQIQKFLERNARAGIRYPEFEMAHFGVSPSDSRLQRPEYLGGTKSPLVVSEVLQTSETTSTSPQGNLAGRGIGASKDGSICSYTCPEHGFIFGLLSIMPKGSYASQGIEKTWLRRSRYDFYFPEFAHLSEQPIKNVELYLSNNDTTNKAKFGFQGIYDELRHMRNQVAGSMRDTFDYWHLARVFSQTPVLNSSFLECNPSKRIFAVQNEPGFIVYVGNLIRAIRPIPKFAEPGLIDHF